MYVVSGGHQVEFTVAVDVSYIHIGGLKLSYRQRIKRPYKTKKTWKCERRILYKAQSATT